MYNIGGSCDIISININRFLNVLRNNFSSFCFFRVTVKITGTNVIETVFTYDVYVDPPAVTKEPIEEFLSMFIVFVLVLAAITIGILISKKL
jgi:hypothetical protein